MSGPLNKKKYVKWNIWLRFCRICAILETDHGLFKMEAGVVRNYFQNVPEWGKSNWHCYHESYIADAYLNLLFDKLGNLWKDKYSMSFNKSLLVWQVSWACSVYLLIFLLCIMAKYMVYPSCKLFMLICFTMLQVLVFISNSFLSYQKSVICYCKFTVIHEDLIFANICKFDHSGIQHFRKTFASIEFT